jgi:hypothetical protein
MEVSMPGMIKAAARIEAARAVLDQRNKANVERRSALVARLASGDTAALDEAKFTSEQNADIEARLHLTAEAKQLADAALARIELEKSERSRARERGGFEATKSRRLAVTRDVERILRNLATSLARLEMLAGDIEAMHRNLHGERLIVPPLSRSAVGSRISEFCAGLGLDAWLPVMCAETKSPPSSLEESERQAQAEYRLPDDDR